LVAGESRYVLKDSEQYHTISMKNAMESLYSIGKGMNIEEKIKPSRSYINRTINKK
jgi:hypothetical protein